MRSRIWAWIVTSSAVVGSSAISTPRLEQQRHRDHDALAHAAGELVRVVVEPPLRRSGCRRGRASRRRAPAPAPCWTRGVGADGLDELRADRERRVERRHRLLEDDRHGAAAAPAHLARRQLQQVLALEQDAAAGDARRRAAAGPSRRARSWSCRSRSRRPGRRSRRGSTRERHVLHGAGSRACGGAPRRSGPRRRARDPPASARRPSGRCRSTPLLVCRVRGSKMSRRPSPKEFRPSTMMAIAMPGTMAG